MHNTKIITFYIKNPNCFLGVTLMYPPKHSCYVSDHYVRFPDEEKEAQKKKKKLFKGTLLTSRKPGFEPLHSNSQSSRLRHYYKDSANRKASMGTEASCDIFLPVVSLGSWLREEH